MGAPDTVIGAFDTGSLAADWVPGSNSLQVTIYAEDGSLFAGGDGTPICGPCQFDMGTGGLAEFSIAEVLIAAGISSLQGGGGYVEIETIGAAPDDVAQTATSMVTGQSFVTGRSPMSLRVPCGGSGGGGLPSGKRTVVATGLTENAGSPMDLARCADASIFLAYAGTASADVDLYLFDQATGAPLVDDAGGVEAMAVAEITGDADGVRLTAGVLASRAGPGDLSVFVFEPNIVSTEPATSAQEIARRHATLSNKPDPFNPQTTLSFTLDRADAAEPKIVDLQGRVVRTLNTGRLPAGAHEIRWDGATTAARRCRRACIWRGCGRARSRRWRSWRC